MSIVADDAVRVSVGAYTEIAQAGLYPGRRVELLGGRVQPMAPPIRAHRVLVSRLSRLAMAQFPESSLRVMTHLTLELAEFEAPEPDLYLLDIPLSAGVVKLPRPRVVVEVADTTCRLDSTIKLQKDAAAGVEDYWVVNLDRQRGKSTNRGPPPADRPGPGGRRRLSRANGVPPGRGGDVPPVCRLKCAGG